MDEKSILKAAYMLFVAVLIALFVGFGVSVFYPEPKMPDYPTDSYSYDKEPTAEQKRV